ncbi:PREDICTED: uncharacterized protein LOC104590202 isoform X2 [Nelumbo nucifera]|uniref:Uncharacterized protein LOC104590202 isoform X2 n=2 Tax=Nelumbo nucifera TaxID=4432 RepID=A0A1U7Z1W5_NELNU|nr:PREDICTED: uncharacterized protein LOC104590202 isoform X2 [Nelumbo nucifera]DAD24001.1 TPA_asm: hypothetical protein HUJ06_025464 [Nelumbo nucifera]
MAYIPPHRRQINGAEKISPTPYPCFPGQFRRSSTTPTSTSCFCSNSERRNNSQHPLRGKNIPYGNDPICKWLMVGPTDLTLLEMKPISHEFVEGIYGEKPLVLTCAHPTTVVVNNTGSTGTSPWVYLAEKLQPDLVKSFQNVCKEIDEFQESEEIKPTFRVRFGKIVFRGGRSNMLDSIKNSLADESPSNEDLQRWFHADIPSSYMEFILSYIVPKTGLAFETENEYYHVKLLDKSDSKTVISCKCWATEADGELELQEIELCQLRHLVVDISCLEKNLDMRMMVSSRKRALMSLTEDQKNSLGNLIRSAVIDPNVKGVLRWPVEDSFEDKYKVIAVYHSKCKSFKNSLLRLKIHDGDQFDFTSSTGMDARNITLEMAGVVDEILQGQKIGMCAATEMFQDTLKLIWDNFLSCYDLSFT